MKLAFVLLILIASAGSVDAAPPHHRCTTAERIPAALRQPRPVLSAVRHGGTKLVRDSFVGVYSSSESANFALRWQSAAVTEAQAVKVLEFLEQSWTKFMVDFGHTESTRWQMYKVNAYLSDPQGTPEIDGGGYATIDDDGYEYFVLDRRTLAEGDDTVAGFVAHEFYHDVQFTMDAYDSSPWYWEATAEWAAMQALPTGAEAYAYTGPFFLHTDLPMYYFGDFGEDFETGVHQYGAGYFIQYVSDTLGSIEPVVQSWEQGTISGEPLSTLFAQTTTATLPAVFTEFAAKSAYLDFPPEDTARIRDSILGFAPDADRARVEAFVPAAGIAMTRSPKPLHSYGFHLIDVMRPISGRAELTLTLENPTTTPTATMGAAMVIGGDAGITYTPLAISGLTGTVVLEIPNTVLAARVAVWVTSDDLRFVRPFALSYAMTPLPAEDPGDDGDMTDDGSDGSDDGGGCCSTGTSGEGAASTFGLAAIAGVVLRRRRRAAC